MGKKLDQACDIYSLGIIAYELVTCTRPFAADTAVAVAFKHLNDPIPRVADIAPDTPDWFQDLVNKAAAKAREERFASVAELGVFLFEKMNEMGIDPGFFSIDGTHFFSQTSSGVGIRPVAGDSDETSLANKAVAEKPSKLEKKEADASDEFKLGDDRANGADTWTLDFVKEDLNPEARSLMPPESADSAGAEPKSKNGKYFFLVIMLIGLSGLGLAYWSDSPLNKLSQEEVQGGGEQAERLSERERLHSELLDFAEDDAKEGIQTEIESKTARYREESGALCG